MNPHRRKLLLRSAAASAATAVCGPAFAIGGDDTSSPNLHIELSAGLDEIAIPARRQNQSLALSGKLLPQYLRRWTPPCWRPSSGSTAVSVSCSISINDLPESTIIHWHGLHVPEDMDGHPRFAIAPGERYQQYVLNE